MEQTAVEYIKEKLLGDEYWYENMTFEQIFEQAKAMEKENLYKCASFWRGKENEIEKPMFDIYYNETFKSE